MKGGRRIRTASSPRVAGLLGPVVVGVLLLPWTPAPAAAHLVSSGLGPLFDGVMHLAVTPEDLLPTIALALFAGMRGPRDGRAVLFALPAVWFVGGIVGLLGPSGLPLRLTTVSFLVFGGLVAADVRLSHQVVLVLAALLGALHGYLNGVEMGTAGLGAVGLLGATASTFVLVALVAAFVVSLERAWARIAVRVAGSWIAAIGLLLLGWSVRGGG